MPKKVLPRKSSFQANVEKVAKLITGLEEDLETIDIGLEHLRPFRQAAKALRKELKSAKPSRSRILGQLKTIRSLCQSILDEDKR